MTAQSSTARDVRWAKALAHPLRVQLVEQFIAARVANPAALARKLSLPPGTVGYHVLRLEALGIVTLESRITVRGFTLHMYRLTDREAAILALEQVGGLARLTASDGVPISPRTARRLADLGGALRGLREAQGMTVAEVARETCLAPTTLDRIERGDADPRMDTIYRLADALGVTLLDVARALS